MRRILALMDTPSEKKNVAVVGAGAWGTALAAHAARLGHRVRLWAHEPDVAETIRTTRENKLYLPGVALPPELSATSSPAEALEGAELVILVPPSAFLRSVCKTIRAHVPAAAPIVIATKGIEESTFELMSAVAAAALGRSEDEMVTLSGPSFAKEVARGLPTDVVVASKDAAVLDVVQRALHSPMFRVYSSADPVGVQVGGAVKNVLAIAAGACDGLDMGMNARAALITRGLGEMARLGVAMGGNPLTFLGMGGVGDLILTATGGLSRNRTLGMKVAEGLDPKAYLASQRSVAEGYGTAKAAFELARSRGVDMPITEQVYHVLHEGRPLLEALKLLLTRPHKEELWGFSDGTAPGAPK